MHGPYFSTDCIYFTSYSKEYWLYMDEILQIVCLFLFILCIDDTYRLQEFIILAILYYPSNLVVYTRCTEHISISKTKVFYCTFRLLSQPVPRTPTIIVQAIGSFKTKFITSKIGGRYFQIKNYTFAPPTVSMLRAGELAVCFIKQKFSSFRLQ